MYPCVCAYNMLAYSYIYKHIYLRVFKMVCSNFVYVQNFNNKKLLLPLISPLPPNNNIKKREELMSWKIIKLYFYFSITDTKIGF